MTLPPKRLLSEPESIPFAWPTAQDQVGFHSEVRVPHSTLKPPLKHGVFLWWSEQTPAWIHPDDLDAALSMVPSCRIFKRRECDNFADRELGYFEFASGKHKFRALPGLWREIETEGFELGDLVEIRSQNGKLRPGMASIRDIQLNRKSNQIDYYLDKNGMRVERSFAYNDIQPASRLGEFLEQRELLNAAIHRIK
ncbi:MAG: hypothetical protein ACI87E_004152 [Mariniblastus sp.]|jgi:hypothetical protein